MDKLKKYNQKLLAIIGTLTLLGLGALIIIGVSALITDSFRRSNNQQIRDNSLTLNQETSAETNVEEKKQDLTFDKAQLIDTLNTLYLVPVSQVNLENDKNGNYGEPILLSGRRGFSYKNTSFHRYSGEYNNILLYNQSNGTKDFLFKEKIFITKFSNSIIDSTHYLLITGTTNDSNNDNKLNNDDLKGFFVYDIPNKKLEVFNVLDHEFVDFYFLHNTNTVLLRYVVDKNKNGEINYLQEPIIIKQLDFEKMELTDFISSDKITELTDIIN